MTPEKDIPDIITTSLTPASLDEDDKRDDVDDELTLYIMRILMYAVGPTVSIFGILGNALSMAVLARHGFSKSSNIILFSLALSDLGFLVGFNSVPKIIYDVGFGSQGFHFSDPSISYALFVLFICFHILDYSMALISLTIPVFITLERLVAVQFPLSFRTIITPARTWAVVIAIYIFWYGIIIYFNSTYRFRYDINTTVGYYYQDPSPHPIVVELMVYMSMRIPPILTFAGCIIIAMKVKVASIKRLKMTSAGSTSSEANNSAANRSFQRTTQVLLAVCALYTFTCVVCNLPTYLPQYFSYSVASDEISNIQAIGYQALNIPICINSSGNFIIYIVMNKNFRDTLSELCICWKLRKN